MTDIKRRQEIFGRHFIAMPQIESFITLLARQFEDTNVIFLMWAATIYLAISQFSNDDSAYVESLTIYSGLLFASFISATCDWVKERQFLKLKNEINN
jgi:magnesium-transporting ATPase (P-type)